MINLITELNWLAIFISVVVNNILGGIWFTLFFGKQYAAALGRKYDSTQKPGILYIVGPLICGFITIVSMDLLIYSLDLKTLSDALIFGSIVGIGLITSTNVNTGINPNIPHPLLYGLVSGSFFTVISLIISVILVFVK